MAKQNTVKPKGQGGSKLNKTAVSASEGYETYLPYILAALVFVLYTLGFSNGMVSMDDHSATVDNPAVRDFAPFSHFSNLGMYAPITWLGYAICFKIAGDSAQTYHALSALVHAINTILVFKLFFRLGKNLSIAAIVAFFFAIHPMQVEAVTWIAGFSTPLFSMFSLLAMYSYVSHTESGTAWGKNYWFALLFFVLGCLSKSAAVSLPLVLLVIDLWKKRPFDRASLLEKAPFFAISLFFGWMTLQTRASAGHMASVTDYSLFDRFLMICHTILFYWTKIKLPIGLSIWYPFEKVNGNWHWTYYAAPVLLAAVFYAAWRFRKAAPVLWCGLLFYMANIVVALPYATFGTFELRSDRYNYLACLGIFAILAALPTFLRERKPSLVAAANLLLVIFGISWTVLAGLRIFDWKDTKTLIDKAIAAQGDNFGKAYLWRGMELGDKGKMKDAVSDFTKALERDSNLIEAYKYRGGIFGLGKQYDKSVADLSKYLAANPDAAEQWYNRGLSYINLGKFPEAIADFTKTIELKPDFARAYRARSNAYKAVGDTIHYEADNAMWEKLDKNGGKK